MHNVSINLKILIGILLNNNNFSSAAVIQTAISIKKNINDCNDFIAELSENH